MKFDINFLRGVLTVVWLAVFVAIWAAAWSRRRRADFAAAAQLPLEADTAGPTQSEVRP